MPRRTDSQSGRAETPDYAAVTLEDELDAAWMAAELAQDRDRKNFSVYDDWHALFSILADVQSALSAMQITPRTAYRRAYGVLKPMIGRIGAKAVIQAASESIYPAEVKARRRTTAEQAKGHAALLAPMGIIGAYGHFQETFKGLYKRDEALKFGAKIHRRIVERGFKGGVTAAIEDIQGRDGNPKRTYMLSYWTVYRNECISRGYADGRLPLVARGLMAMPNDLLELRHFALLKR